MFAFSRVASAAQSCPPEADFPDCFLHSTFFAGIVAVFIAMVRLRLEMLSSGRGFLFTEPLAAFGLKHFMPILRCTEHLCHGMSHKQCHLLEAALFLQ